MQTRNFLEMAASLLAIAACSSDVALGGGPGEGDGGAGVDAAAGGGGADGGASDSDAGAGDGDGASGSTVDAGGATVVATFADVNGCLGRIAVDATNVYAVALALQRWIYTAPLAGGPTTALNASGSRMLAVSPSAVYTADMVGCGGGPSIYYCAKSGCGNPGPSLKVDGHDACIMDVAADDTNVYWAAFASTLWDAGPPWPGAVGKIPADGGPPTVLDTPVDPIRIVPSGDTLFYLSTPTPSTYLTSQYFGLTSVPISGGAPTVLVPPNVAELFSMTVDASNVYYGTRTGDVFKIPRAGGTPTMLAKGTHVDDAGDVVVNGRTTWGMGDQMAVDANRVYFRSAGSVNAVPIAGGAVTSLATSSLIDDCEAGLAVDASYVYWTDGNKVMKVAK